MIMILAQIINLAQTDDDSDSGSSPAIIVLALTERSEERRKRFRGLYLVWFLLRRTYFSVGV